MSNVISSLEEPSVRLTIMIRQLLQWLNRVNATPHGTTNEIPFERLRQENLKPITAIRLPVAEEEYGDLA